MSPFPSTMSKSHPPLAQYTPSLWHSVSHIVPGTQQLLSDQVELGNLQLDDSRGGTTPSHTRYFLWGLLSSNLKLPEQVTLQSGVVQLAILRLWGGKRGRWPWTLEYAALQEKSQCLPNLPHPHTPSLFILFPKARSCFSLRACLPQRTRPTEEKHSHLRSAHCQFT